MVGISAVRSMTRRWEMVTCPKEIFLYICDPGEDRSAVTVCVIVAVLPSGETCRSWTNSWPYACCDPGDGFVAAHGVLELREVHELLEGCVVSVDVDWHCFAPLLMAR